MIQTSVISENVARIGWANEKLYVEFKKGGMYVYRDAPFEAYTEWLAAPSIGKHLHSVIKVKFPASPLSTAEAQQVSFIPSSVHIAQSL